MRDYKEHLLHSGASIEDALYRLNILAKDAVLFIVDADQKLLGSLTDGDVRRGLLKGARLQDKVEKIIQAKPKFIRKGEKNIEKIISLRDKNFRIIPVVNDYNVVINVINFGLLKSYLPIDAVIMAGGKGMRLRPLTENTPKPLLKIGDKPIIEYNIDQLSKFGIDDFWVAINYLGEQIKNHLQKTYNTNIQIEFIKESKPLGTIGALSLIKNFKHDHILLTNADVLTNLDYEHFFLHFLQQDADFSVVSIPYKVNVPYAVLETTNGHVLSLKEKPTYTFYSNAGIYLMKRELVEYLPDADFYNATDLMECLIAEGKRVISYPLMGYWLDIGKPEDFEKAQRDILQLKL